MALAEGWFIKKVEDLLCTLKSAASEEERDEAIYTFIEWMESRDSLSIPEFDSNLEWLNCKNSLFFKDQLHGKLCVLDFFTYCCINCIHILPDLEALEHLHSEKDGLVILGVHSAKFENEKSSTNILSAVLRYDIRHPVVNDSEAKLWHSLSVQCWPTLVVVSPEGKILLSLVGEGHRDPLLQFVGTALKYYKQRGTATFLTSILLLSKRVKIELEMNRAESRILVAIYDIAIFPHVMHWRKKPNTLTNNHKII